MNSEVTSMWGSIAPGRGALPALLLAAVCCLAAYGVALHGPLFFDDLPNVTDNNLLKIDGRTFDHWREAALSSNAGLLYRPVAMLTFAANHVLEGQFSPFGLKLTNLVLHLAVGFLVYLFCLAVLRAPALAALPLDTRQRRLAALTAAALWLLHPVHVSTVLYAVQRMAQLSALFTLAGLVIFLAYRLRWAERGAKTPEILTAGLWLAVCGLLAVLSKENGALLPWLVLAVEACLFRGLWAGVRSRRLALAAWGLFLLPLAVLAAWLLLDFGSFTVRFRGREFSFEERVLTQFRVLWSYVSWLAVPNILQMGFFHDDVKLSAGLLQPVTTALAIALWLAAVALTAALRTRYPLALFALCFFLAGHSMESSVLPLQIAFEHRNYLPGVAVLLLLSVLFVQGVARFQGLKSEIACAGLAAIFLALLAVRASIWSDEFTLARFNAVNHPESPRANFFYGNALFEQFKRSGELGLNAEQEAALAVNTRGYFERMHRLDPRDFAAPVMLYQIDTLYFPRLATENDWLGVMAALASTRRLQSSDRTAIGALVRFVSVHGSDADKGRVEAMLRALLARYPTRMDLLAHYYRLLRGRGRDADPQLLAALERARDKAADSRQVGSYLAQYHSGKDLGATYEAIRLWLERDRLRRELSLIAGVFESD